ncbi:MAG: hypothetical protein KDA17_05200 [Candidatus Saccharibacteria bacterium]|nr:hypothetical protein [Candidatus Saccharibacteria bacterium]
MTPERIAALEACAEALKELILKYRPREWRLKETTHLGASSWKDAIAAVEQLEGVGDGR